MNRNQQLTMVSGDVSSSDPLVHFIYLLGRDHLPLASIETILQEHLSPDVGKTCHFSNGYLANYALNVASFLRSSDTHDKNVN